MNTWLNVSPSIKKSFSEHWIDEKTLCLFFMEFEIPWIRKWQPEFGYTDEGIPCIWRVSSTKFWDKLLRDDPETGKPYGYETLHQMEEKISLYQKEINNQ